MEFGDNNEVSKEKRRRIIALCAVILLAVVVTVSLILENRPKPKPAQAKKFEGKKLIDLGWCKVTAEACGKGKQTIVVIPGYMEQSAATWMMVKRDISELSRVIIFDRPGIGGTQKSSKPRTSEVKAEELHTMLQKMDVEGPYILMSHEMGTFDARVFANKYPKEVCGMILLDPQPEDMMLNIEKYLPADQIDMLKKINYPDGSYEDMVKSAEQAKGATRNLKDIPLVIVAAKGIAGEQAGNEQQLKVQEEVLTMQKQMAELSSKGKFLISEKDNNIYNARYGVLGNNPELVMKSVKEMMDMVKKR